MITKKVMLEFANPRIQAKDHFLDVSRAVDHASFNLYIRHNVRLHLPTVSENNKVIVEIEIPEEIAGNFSSGNHLRGVSAYLLKHHGDYYKKFTVGNRLLYYIDI